MKNFFTRWAIASPLWLVYATWTHNLDNPLASWVYWGVGLLCYLYFALANKPWITTESYEERLCGCDICRYEGRY